MVKDRSVENIENEFNFKLTTEEGRALLIRNMKTLSSSKGWNFMKIYLLSRLDRATIAIKNIDKNYTIDELNKLRIEIHLLEELIELPDELITELEKDLDDDSMIDEVYL